MNEELDRTGFTDVTDTANLRALRQGDFPRLGWRMGRVLALGAVDLVHVWRIRRHVRRVLKDFTDLELKDIGLSRTEARAEISKPFWRG